MQDGKHKANVSASEQIFARIEEDMEPGDVRDLWLSLRTELNEGGPDSVRTYLDAEYKQRKADVESALDELSSQLGGIN